MTPKEFYKEAERREREKERLLERSHAVHDAYLMSGVGRKHLVTHPTNNGAILIDVPYGLFSEFGWIVVHDNFTKYQISAYYNYRQKKFRTNYTIFGRETQKKVMEVARKHGDKNKRCR